MNSNSSTKRKLSVKLKKRYTGIGFVVPFIIGFILFFAKPMIESIVYTFNKIVLTDSGYELIWKGLYNYRRLINDVTFLKSFIGQAQTFLWQVPVVILLSMFIAMLLNRKFPGRLFFRCIAFLPVIFASGTVVSLLSRTTGGVSLSTDSNMLFLVEGDAKGFVLQLAGAFGFSEDMIGNLSYYTSSIFNLVWSCGVQVILFIIGLGSIPSDLYEVCQMEGATGWETFWKITFPLLTPTILLTAIYTIVKCIVSDSSIGKTIIENMQNGIEYACTQSWAYSIFVVLVVFIVYKVISKFTVYLD